MVAEILETLNQLGVTVTVLDDDRIRIEPASRIPAGLIPLIRKAKPEIIAALRSGGKPAINFRPSEPITREMLREASDPVEQAVFQLLRDGEYVDQQGIIRRVQ